MAPLKDHFDAKAGVLYDVICDTDTIPYGVCITEQGISSLSLRVGGPVAVDWRIFNNDSVTALYTVVFFALKTWMQTQSSYPLPWSNKLVYSSMANPIKGVAIWVCFKKNPPPYFTFTVLEFSAILCCAFTTDKLFFFFLFFLFFLSFVLELT